MNKTWCKCQDSVSYYKLLRQWHKNRSFIESWNQLACCYIGSSAVFVAELTKSQTDDWRRFKMFLRQWKCWNLLYVKIFFSHRINIWHVFLYYGISFFPYSIKIRIYDMRVDPHGGDKCEAVIKISISFETFPRSKHWELSYSKKLNVNLQEISKRPQWQRQNTKRDVLSLRKSLEG